MELTQAEIDKITDSVISPILAIDGGLVRITVADTETMTVNVQLNGSYRGSPCRSIIINHIITPILQHNFGKSCQVRMTD